MGGNGFLQMLQEAVTPEWDEVLRPGKAGHDGLFRICEATKLSKMAKSHYFSGLWLVP